MLFSSLLFLFGFLPIVLAGYYLCPRRFRTVFLFLCNLVFYAAGEPYFVLLMLLSIAINWAGGLLASGGGRRKRQAAMWTSVALDLLLLGVFKYLGLIGRTLRLLPPFSDLPPLEIPLPIGISFYTFQTVSYDIDLLRGNAALQKMISNTCFPTT